jgi:hypothetical protein
LNTGTYFSYLSCDFENVNVMACEENGDCGTKTTEAGTYDNDLVSSVTP